MDERQRLLERVFSRKGASEHPEDHRDPVTGETVSMTPSEWALAEYDRLHPHGGEDAGEGRAPNAEQADARQAGTGAQTRASAGSTRRTSGRSRPSVLAGGNACVGRCRTLRPSALSCSASH